MSCRWLSSPVARVVPYDSPIMYFGDDQRRWRVRNRRMKSLTTATSLSKPRKSPSSAPATALLYPVDTGSMKHRSASRSSVRALGTAVVAVAEPSCRHRNVSARSLSCRPVHTGVPAARAAQCTGPARPCAATPMTSLRRHRPPPLVRACGHIHHTTAARTGAAVEGEAQRPPRRRLCLSLH